MPSVLVRIVAVVFLCMQLSLVLHNAEHGFAEHEHNGELCELYVLAKHNDVTAPSTLSVQPFTFLHVFRLVPHSSLAIISEQGKANLARAPPLLS